MTDKPDTAPDEAPAIDPAEQKRLDDLETQAAAVRAQVATEEPDPETPPERETFVGRNGLTYYVDDPDGDPVPDAGPEKGTDEWAEANRTAMRQQEAETGAVVDPGLITTAPPGFAVKPAGESAPEGVKTKREDGVSVLDGELAGVPTTMADQKAPRLKGETYRKGYVGELPAGPGPDGEREDLTLAAALDRIEPDDRITQAIGREDTEESADGR